MKVLATFTVVLALTGAAACMHQRAAGNAAAEEPGLPDSQLGLEKTSVRETPEPVVAARNSTEPGESVAVGPYVEGAPPVISHSVEGLLPITKEMNACMECHDLPEASGDAMEDGVPFAMPRSHYTDLRRSPDRHGSTVIGARYNCTQCHVAMTDAPPLVANTYGE